MDIIGTNKAELEKFVELNEYVKNAYFWSSNGNAANRRRREQQLTKKLQFTVNGENVNASIETRMSCRNTYVTKKVTVNGQKKDIRYIKKVLNSLN